MRWLHWKPLILLKDWQQLQRLYDGFHAQRLPLCLISSINDGYRRAKYAATTWGIDPCPPGSRQRFPLKSLFSGDNVSHAWERHMGGTHHDALFSSLVKHFQTSSRSLGPVGI